MLKNFLLCFITLCFFTLNAHPELTTLTEVDLENGPSFTITMQDDTDKCFIELNPIRPTAVGYLEPSEDKSKLILNLPGIQIPSGDIPALLVNTDTINTISIRRKPGLRPALQIIFTLVNARNKVNVDQTREKVIVTFMKGSEPPSQTPIPEISSTLPQTEMARLLPFELASNDGDILDVIIFWHNGEFRRDTVTVKNGQISYREIGAIEIAGKELRQIGELLSERLKEYLVNYDVIVIPKDRTGQTDKSVGIASAVGVQSLAYRRTGPGEYIWGENLTLFNFISSSGGWTNRADLRDVKLIHRNKLATQSGRATQVNVQRMKETGDHRTDLKLRPNDLIYIPALIKADEQQVGVYGLVKKPGMKKIGKGWTISQAIAVAGGPKYVKAMRVILLRRNGDKIERDLAKILITRDGNADKTLKHGDVIYVGTKLTKE